MRLTSFVSATILASLATVARAEDCARFDGQRLSYTLAAVLTRNGGELPLTIEGSRADIVIVRLRTPDGSIDQLSEMRDFVPERTLNGATGDSQTFSMRPVNGSLGGFEPGAEATYEQTSLVNGKPVRTEFVTQKVKGEATRYLSGCKLRTVRIERAFEDKATGARRKQEFDYAPALGYPLWTRIETATPAGPAVQTIEVKSIELPPMSKSR